MLVTRIVRSVKGVAIGALALACLCPVMRASSSATEITVAPAGPASATVIEPLASPKDARPNDGLKPALLDCRAISFNSARIEHRGSNFILIVRGDAAYVPTEIALVPVMYVMMPEYWQISLVGCRAGTAARPQQPYVVELSVNGTLGHRGIRLIGASNQQRIDISQ